MSKQLDIFIESLGTLLSPFVIDYNFILCKNIYKNTVDGMMTNYVFPQENGHREQVKWFRIGDGRDGLLCKMKAPLGLNLANYTDESLEQAQHPFAIDRKSVV